MEKNAIDTLCSVIVPNSRLQLDQCGLPRRLALELYKKELVSRLIDCNYVDTVEDALLAVKFQWDQVWKELEEILQRIPILLSFPTRFSRAAVQAFEAVLVEGKAIHIHPTIARQVRIDFSGQTAIARLPNSEAARVESSELIPSDQAFVNQRDGEIDQTITREAAVGIYYLTMNPAEMPQDDRDEWNSPLISSIAELEHAMDVGHVQLHDKVRMRISRGKVVDGTSSAGNVLLTTAGRALFNAALPAELPYFNEALRHKELTRVIELCKTNCGLASAIVLVEVLSRLGFDMLTRSGISLGMLDLKVPTEREKNYAEAKKRIEKLNKYRNKQPQLINETEYRVQVYDAWVSCCTRTGDDVARRLAAPEYRLNPLSINSDLRSYHSTNNLCGMIGSVRFDQPTPLIRSNYSEGLRSIDYFRFAVDRKLRAWILRGHDRQRRSWRIAKKLSDVMRDTRISMHDCQTTEGLRKAAIREGDHVVVTIEQRIVGRVSLVRILEPRTGELIVDRNQLITSEIAGRLQRLRLEHVEVRSPVKCQAAVGVCQLCYGTNPSSGKLPAIGERVGMQSVLAICEQARSFGLQRWRSSTNPWVEEVIDHEWHAIYARSHGRVHFDETLCTVNRDGVAVVLGQPCRLIIHDEQGQPIDQVDVPYASLLRVKCGDTVQWSQSLANWKPGVHSLIATGSGRARIRSGALEVIDDHGVTRQTRSLYSGTKVLVEDGSQVQVGDVLAEWCHPIRNDDVKEHLYALPKWVATLEHLESLLNASLPTEQAVMADFDGTLSVAQAGNKLRLKLTSLNGDQSKEYLIPPWKCLWSIYSEPWSRPMQAGERLSRGQPGWHDIRRVLGLDEFFERWLSSMLWIYQMNRLSIAEQHLDLILSRLTGTSGISS